MKLAIPDMISNSYFPAAAAVELGFFKDEGLDMTLELIYPVDRTLEVLRDGGIEFVGGSAHSTPHAFPGWKGGKLIAALAQNMYWFLILRADLKAKKGDINAIRGLKIAAAPLVNLGLRQLLIESGIDEKRDNINIVPVPMQYLGEGHVKNFGVGAAKALEAGAVDGFWANGMGAEVAVKGGYGTLVLDARREGTALMKGYTFPALVTSEKIIRENPAAARAAVKAVQMAQQMLKEDPNRATAIGKKLFPPAEAAMIAELIRRDAPFYESAISPETVEAMNRFAQRMGLLSRPVSYDDVVFH